MARASKMVRGPHIRMQRLQRADKILGLLGCVALQPVRWLRRVTRPRRPPAGGPARILLIKFWGIGSLQLLTPAVRVLRRDHPRARLALLTLSENEEFARGVDGFDEVVTLDVRTGSGLRGWLTIFGRILGLVRRLRRERFDRVYDFEFFTRFSALVSLATGARETSGFAAPDVWRGRFHSRNVPFNRYWHVARNFRALAGGEDGREIVADDLSPFAPLAEHHARALERLREAGLAAERPFVVLNPNAGQLSLERRWPASSFADLARRLAVEDGTPVVLVGAPAEAEYVHGIAREIGPLPRGLLADLAGQLSIGELCALLSRAAALVTNDSGPMHLGAALGAPTIGLFGPETPVMYGPLGPRASALWKPPSCSPCINVHDNKVFACIHGRPECLVNIQVDEVLEQTRARVWDGVLSPAARRSRLRVVRGAEPRVAEEAGR